MEIEKAIKLLKADKDLISRKVTRHTFYEYEEAVQALEKQIPYQPSEIDCVNEENNILDGYCKCNKLVDSRMKYCRLCGQKLDWEVETDE
jgi:hypothetical protein